jgi:hypothetical protein
MRKTKRKAVKGERPDPALLDLGPALDSLSRVVIS